MIRSWAISQLLCVSFFTCKVGMEVLPLDPW